MIRSMRMLLMGIVCALGSGVAIAADRISPETAVAIIQKSGVADQLADFAPSMRAGITTNPELASQMTEAQLATLLGAFDAAYAPVRLQADISAALVKMLPKDAAKDALAWLESEVGTKITALENSATELANDPDKMAAAQTLLERLPPRRAERYIALMKATGADQSGARIVLNSSLGMAYAASATLGAAKPDLDAMRKELEAGREQMAQSLGNTYITMFASVYQELPETELDRYLAFAESPAGKAYHAALTDAIEVALINAALETGRLIGEAKRAATVQSDA